MSVKLDEIFDSTASNLIFRDKTVLQPNFSPETIPHRDDQIKQIASILAPSLRGEKTSNLFLYGKTGTGKTLSVQFVKNELLKRSKDNANFQLKIIYLNCKLKKVSDTEYRILAEIISRLGGNVPTTGLPTDAVYNRFIDLIEKEKQIIILVLDEVDHAVKKISDAFLYNLLRINSELNNTQISIVGISNDLTFLDGLDPRVKSSLSEEEIVFPPYNALQLQDILKERARLSFKEGIISEGVLAKCAAYAAREHGDARRALDLMRISAEICERENEKQIFIKHIDAANEKIERDKILDVIRTEPQQFQLVLLSIINLIETQKDAIFTGDIYSVYQDLCLRNKIEVLTPRRVSDILAEFDMLGLISTRVISKGRGGRMREIKLTIPKNILGKAKEIIKDSLVYV